MRIVVLGLAVIAIALTSSCVEYPVEGPKEDYERVQKLIAKEEEAKKQAAAGDPHAAAKEAFGTYCASCHGPDGKAATPVASAMNPKPRNLTELAWQDKVDDAHITKVIKEGGPAVGLSATMAPWGAVLNDDQIKGVVAWIRSIKE